MKSFSHPQQRQHRVVYGCEMSPQVKQPVPARCYFPQHFLGREGSKKLVRPVDLSHPCFQPDSYTRAFVSHSSVSFPPLHLICTLVKSLPKRCFVLPLTHPRFCSVKLRLCYVYLMGVEPLPNIRDGILVERLVKTVRYVADMRRCQYVVQRPEGERRRQRLNVEYVDRRAGDLLVLQHANQSLLFDDRPARRIDQPRRWLHSLQLRGAYQATRTAAQHQMDRQDVGPLEQLVLGNQECSRGFGGLWRHVLAPVNQIHSKSVPNPRDL